MNSCKLCLLLSGALMAGLCATLGTDQPQPALVSRLNHLGSHSFKITTRSAEAQRAFDRGLTLAYSFGHFAAEQEFRAAIKADPDCAMAWWGIALVNGPHINFPMVPPDKAATAWDAITHAQKASDKCSPLEKRLILALAERYADPQPEDRSGLDRAYSQAMQAVRLAYPANADVCVLAAEAAMDLHPWDYWSKGSPEPWTPEIVGAIESALRLDPKHPGANHLYIHILEASPEPGKALIAADRLGTLVPDSSHMVHMPSHIYARVGKWDQAATANRDAMKADTLYRSVYPRPGFYAMYMAHNAHFRAFVAMMQGQSGEALTCARAMVAGIPEEFLKNFTPIVDGYMVFVSEALMRFGRWEEVLKEPEPREGLFLSRALWRYTRTVALTALGRIDQAKAERQLFTAAVADVPKDRTMGNNSAADLLAIASLVVDGEMASKTGQTDEAITKLREAVALEDKLLYDEPPDWIQPVRHTLGAVLMRAGKAADGETVYREDLRAWPENGWGLMGLRDALRKQGKTEEAEKVQARLHKAWAHADIKPPSTCYCQTIETASHH
jgi:tetratricopeptide (TPR) repeat protein